MLDGELVEQVKAASSPEAAEESIKNEIDDRVAQGIASTLDRLKPEQLAGIWYTVLTGLPAFAVLALVLAAWLTNSVGDKDTTAAWAVVTAALGVIGGLLAPGPIGKR